MHIFRSLQGNGLCDRRTRPCRKVKVLGTGFIPSENLTCHVEEFKVMVTIVASLFLVSLGSFHSTVPLIKRNQVLCYASSTQIDVTSLCVCSLVGDKLCHISVKVAKTPKFVNYCVQMRGKYAVNGCKHEFYSN